MPQAKLVPELYVSDIDRSLTFYLDLLGFRVLFGRPEDQFAYLALEGVELMLEEHAASSRGERIWWTAPAEKPYGRGISLQMKVDDVDAISRRLQDAKWPLFRPLEERWYRIM